MPSSLGSLPRPINQDPVVFTLCSPFHFRVKVSFPIPDSRQSRFQTSLFVLPEIFHPPLEEAEVKNCTALTCDKFPPQKAFTSAGKPTGRTLSGRRAGERRVSIKGSFFFLFDLLEGGVCGGECLTLFHQGQLNLNPERPAWLSSQLPSPTLRSRTSASSHSTSKPPAPPPVPHTHSPPHKPRPGTGSADQ